MVKTSEEIKRGLQCLVRGKYPNAYCGGCSYHANAAQYLYECKSPEIITDTIAYIQQIERGRDEAVKALSRYKKCIDCKYWPIVVETSSFCNNCESGNKWQWRGAQEEA